MLISIDSISIRKPKIDWGWSYMAECGWKRILKYYWQEVVLIEISLPVS